MRAAFAIIPKNVAPLSLFCEIKMEAREIRGRLIVLGTQQQVKERRLYYPTKFSELELIVRNNFCAVGGQIRFYESAKGRN